MAKTIRLTESDLERIIERVISEQENPESKLRDIEKSIVNSTMKVRNPASVGGHTYGVFKIDSVSHTVDDVNNTPENIILYLSGVNKRGKLQVGISCDGRSEIIVAQPGELRQLRMFNPIIDWVKTNWCPARGNKSGKTDF